MEKTIHVIIETERSATKVIGQTTSERVRVELNFQYFDNKLSKTNKLKRTTGHVEVFGDKYSLFQHESEVNQPIGLYPENGAHKFPENKIGYYRPLSGPNDTTYPVEIVIY